MNKAFHEGYMYKQAKGPPALPVKPQVKPPALPKYNPAASINNPLSKADQASRRAFRGAAGSAKPALPAQAKPGILRSAPAVKQLPVLPDVAGDRARKSKGLLRHVGRTEYVSPTETRGARLAARGSRLARLRHGLGLTPWGAAAEAAYIGADKYKTYLDEDEEDFNREQELKYERIRQLTGMPRRLGPQGSEYRAKQPVQYGSHEDTPAARASADARRAR
jgi:hypothetical protein